jgi:hypothetical protein
VSVKTISEQLTGYGKANRNVWDKLVHIFASAKAMGEVPVYNEE